MNPSAFFDAMKRYDNSRQQQEQYRKRRLAELQELKQEDILKIIVELEIRINHLEKK